MFVEKWNQWPYMAYRHYDIAIGKSMIYNQICGWVAERLNATVLKTVIGATLSGVQIPPHPPDTKK